MLVQCGNQIKYGFLPDDIEKRKSSSEVLDKELNCQFDEVVEIV